jgi:tetratricopeptide (TPR) repeat protein
MPQEPSKLNLRLRALAFLALMALMLYLGGWLLLNPNNPVNRTFRAPITEFDSRVVVGPYPTERDFASLRQSGVTTIVSLLDARVPYEDLLLERERKAAAQFGFKFLNFPMTSFFGHHIGDNYDINALAAARAIQGSKDRIYLHCYLGIHRVASVREHLQQGRVDTAAYLPRAGDVMSRETRAERVSMRYDAGDFEGALKWYAGIDRPLPATQLLAGWANLRLNRVDEAEGLFRHVADSTPELWDSGNGLAYCALRRGHLTAAEGGFRSVLEKHPEDPQALVGLAITQSRSGHYDIAAKTLQTVLAAHPDNTEAVELLKTYRARSTSEPLAH